MYKKIMLLLFFNCASLSTLAQLQLKNPSGLFMSELLGRSLILEPFKNLATVTLLRELLTFLQSQKQAECRVCHQRVSTSLLVDACTKDHTHLFHRFCVENRKSKECPSCNNHISLQLSYVRATRNLQRMRVGRGNAATIATIKCFHCDLPAQLNRPIMSACKNSLSQTQHLTHGCHEDCLEVALREADQRRRARYPWREEDAPQRTCPHPGCSRSVLDEDDGPGVVLDQFVAIASECPICLEGPKLGNPIISTCSNEFNLPEIRHGAHAPCIANAQKRGYNNCLLCRDKELRINPSAIVAHVPACPACNTIVKLDTNRRNGLNSINVSCSNHVGHDFFMHHRCVVNFLRGQHEPVCREPHCNSTLRIMCPGCRRLKPKNSYDTVLCSSHEHYVCKSCLVEHINEQSRELERKCAPYKEEQENAADAIFRANARSLKEAEAAARQQWQDATNALNELRQAHHIRCWEPDCERVLYPPNYRQATCAGCSAHLPDQLLHNRQCPRCVDTAHRAGAQAT